VTDLVSGQCLCGAVRMQGRGDIVLNACHCQMCQRWHGGPSMAANFADGITITKGADNVGWFTSSDWGERGFCKTCGSTLFWRLREDPSVLSGEAGSFALPSGLEIKEHFFIDEQPDYYAFQGDGVRLTGAEVFARYGMEPPEKTND